MVLQSFSKFVRSLGEHGQKLHIVVAFSGGIDSVVLAYCCKLAQIDFSIAHCNFNLRGPESMRDEAFAKQMAANWGVPLHLQAFNTEAFALEQKFSTQVAARNLRYPWFETLLLSKHHFIATAHHADDNIETLLMHFFKGTGIAGLRGIPARAGQLIRPLLNVSRQQIEDFAATHNLVWVQDSSNASSTYTRNFFRNEVLPLIETHYPAVRMNLMHNLHRFADVEILYNEAIAKYKKKLLIQQNGDVKLPIKKLRLLPAWNTLLFEAVKEYGFLPAQMPDIIHLTHAETGRHVDSPQYRIFKNRDWLLISSKVADEKRNILLTDPHEDAMLPQGRLSVCYIEKESVLKDALQKNGRDEILVNAAEIDFPLIIRPWKPGDYFYPLGMHKKKKIARFLIDQKIAAPDKEKVWVVESNKRIVWIIGLRPDDRFKLSAGHSRAWHFQFLPHI